MSQPSAGLLHSVVSVMCMAFEGWGDTDFERRVSSLPSGSGGRHDGVFVGCVSSVTVPLVALFFNQRHGSAERLRSPARNQAAERLFCYRALVVSWHRFVVS